MQVKQGSTLLVARQGALDADVTEHLADNAMISFAPEIVLRRLMVKVQKGDTLATLARCQICRTASGEERVNVSQAWSL